MLGKNKGLKAKVLSIAPHVKFTHCIIHREALASKTLEPELNNVLQTAIKMVNFIKSRPLNTRLFTLLCQEMGSTHKSLLFHSEVRWLSRGKVLTRLFELRSEVRTFLSDANSAFAHHLTDSEWIARLAYLSCIFDKLNTLNLSLQGLNTNILTLSDKVNAFTTKLQRWAVRAESGDFEMFLELHDFLAEDDVNEYPGLSKAAMDILTPFGSTYLCEKTLSSLAYIKNKYRCRLSTVEENLCFAVSVAQREQYLLDKLKCELHSLGVAKMECICESKQNAHCFWQILNVVHHNLSLNDDFQRGWTAMLGRCEHSTITLNEKYPNVNVVKGIIIIRVLNKE
ncbi:Zinc finger MYM-type protein 6 [Merluccius polli]|uniref:Zinc finger MYM-type protein 6 n=1 Tax=Merluccius polli TaxID=89951 RepID=A0AA47NWY9_MERPO|nr:Zinc finger MYM-type protein 6 [Merluccius polli]